MLKELGSYLGYSDLELHDFAQLSDVQVVADVESVEELAEQSLLVDHFAVDTFDHDAEKSGVFKAEVFILDLALSY